MNVIERFTSRQFVKTMSRYLMSDYERRSQVSTAVVSQIKTSDVVVNAADIWIQKNLSKEIRIEDIANYASVSTRTLIRHFKAALDETPVIYIQKARLEKCKLLLRYS